MESAAAHRKIELQSPEDFAYLISNVRRSAADSIAAAFPPIETAASNERDDDDLHARVEKLVNDYIETTFRLAAPNLTINGLPVNPILFLQSSTSSSPSTPEAYAPFDGRRRQRVEDLAREEEDLLREIAALKRRVPGAAAAQYGDAVRAGVAADEAAVEAVVAKTERQGSGDGGRIAEAAAGLQRQEAVEAVFGETVERLGRLKGGMSATVARMERARGAGEYVVTER